MKIKCISFFLSLKRHVLIKRSGDLVDAMAAKKEDLGFVQGAHPSLSGFLRHYGLLSPELEDMRVTSH